MSICFVVANQKGGVGKTTTAVNVAACLAQKGCRVLLIDLDPQSNATMACGFDRHGLLATIYDVLLGVSTLSEAVQVCEAYPLAVIPATPSLSGIEIELVSAPEREWRLKKALAAVESDYDYVFIDCPPTLGLLTLNGFCAAHRVLIPMQCEYYALGGLSELVASLHRVRARLNSELEIEGLIRTMYDARSSLSQQVAKQLIEHFGDKVFETIIPRNVRLAEAPSFGLPGVWFDRQAKGARAYAACAEELMQRCPLTGSWSACLSCVEDEKSVER